MTEWPTFLIDYDTPDGIMCTEIKAPDAQHAELYMECLRKTGRLIGELVETIYKPDLEDT